MKHGAFRYQKIGFEFPKKIFILTKNILDHSRSLENVKNLIYLKQVNEFKTK